jgi:hypothetical protein
MINVFKVSIAMVVLGTALTIAALVMVDEGIATRWTNPLIFGGVLMLAIGVGINIIEGSSGKFEVVSVDQSDDGVWNAKTTETPGKLTLIFGGKPEEEEFVNYGGAWISSSDHSLPCGWKLTALSTAFLKERSKRIGNTRPEPS